MRFPTFSVEGWGFPGALRTQSPEGCWCGTNFVSPFELASPLSSWGSCLLLLVSGRHDLFPSTPCPSSSSVSGEAGRLRDALESPGTSGDCWETCPCGRFFRQSPCPSARVSPIAPPARGATALDLCRRAAAKPLCDRKPFSRKELPRRCVFLFPEERSEGSFSFPSAPPLVSGGG